MKDIGPPRACPGPHQVQFRAHPFAPINERFVRARHETAGVSSLQFGWELVGVIGLSVVGKFGRRGLRHHWTKGFTAFCFLGDFHATTYLERVHILM